MPCRTGPLRGEGEATGPKLIENRGSVDWMDPWKALFPSDIRDPKKQKFRTFVIDQTFILELFEISLESLILAQDERWRRA